MPTKSHKTSKGAVIRPPIRSRLFWPLIARAAILPLVSWELASNENKAKAGAKTAGVMHGRPGPWGDLNYVRINIEIPDHFLDADESDPNEWIFPGLSKQQIIEFLGNCSLRQEQFDTLINKTPWVQTNGTWKLVPTDDLVWSLSELSREKIYDVLSQSGENVDQHYAFVYRADCLPARLELSGLQPKTVEMFKSLLYGNEKLKRFADSDLVLRKIEDHKERLRFIKAVSRRSSLLVKVQITPQSNIDELLSYWGAGGRAKDLRPLLESLARVPEGCSIDIAHFLPPFARQRIYTYPYPKDAAEGQQDCHWTSINFFNDQPTPGFANPAQVQTAIENNFTEIQGGLLEAHFGDVLFLKNEDDIIVHSAVYIADDIVFTKNGSGGNQPWIYMKIEDMIPYYEGPNQKLKVLVFRKKPTLG